jgi:hypothetical protein
LHSDFGAEKERLNTLAKDGLKGVGSAPDVSRSLASVQTALASASTAPSAPSPSTLPTSVPAGTTTNVIPQERKNFPSLEKEVRAFRGRLTKYQEEINVENQKVANLRLRYKQIINELWLTDAQVNKQNTEIIATYRTLVTDLTTLRTNIIPLEVAAQSVEADLGELRGLLSVP